MSEAAPTLIWAATLVIMTATLCLAALHAWRGWLEVRRLELGLGRTADDAAAETGVRIEVANMKERLRKLEAIARGVDL